MAIKKLYIINRKDKYLFRKYSEKMISCKSKPRIREISKTRDKGENEWSISDSES